MIWKNKLTDEELSHLNEANCFTLSDVKRSCEGQAEMRVKFPKWEPCFECKAIARKLGLPA
jgi:hypothetical protein